MRSIIAIISVLALAGSQVLLSAEKTSKEALQSFNDLVGEWRGTGEPEGTRAEKRRGFWIETIQWGWKFSKSGQAWLSMTLDKGKHFSEGELRYLSESNKYQLTMTTKEKQKRAFVGTLDDKRMELDWTDPETKEVHRLSFTFLHSNRYLYRYEVKPVDRARFKQQYRVGATKKGVPFAGKGDSSPECVVSGGKGTIEVSFKGKTYYVCCTGCAGEFNDNPEKYIKEYEARKAKEKK